MRKVVFGLNNRQSKKYLICKIRYSEKEVLLHHSLVRRDWKKPPMCGQYIRLQVIITYRKELYNITMKFLYWNINNQQIPFEEKLKELLSDKEIDVLILSENRNITDSKLTLDTDLVTVPLFLNNSKLKWINVYYRKNDNYQITHFHEFTEIEYDEDNVTDGLKKGNTRQVNRIQIFKISGNIPDTFFACIHFPSKLFHDEITHLQIVQNYISKIHNATNVADRLFVVGDFNMDPFDYAMVEPKGFNAHNNRDLVVSDTKFKFGSHNILYYNPSWTLLGDFVNKLDYSKHKRTGGSFYFKKKISRSLYWHLIDQIIMRKSLINEFVSEDLEIIENEFIKTEILREPKKDENKIDHFPLKFSFNFKTK